MLWVGVAIGDHPAELLVATAALHLLELHDVALTARREGGVFDPSVEGVDRIYGEYALRRRHSDVRRNVIVICRHCPARPAGLPVPAELTGVDRGSTGL